jgi:hypothetical protein
MPGEKRQQRIKCLGMFVLLVSMVLVESQEFVECQIIKLICGQTEDDKSDPGGSGSTFDFRSIRIFWASNVFAFVARSSI